jgi:hypothetical protein
MVMPSGANWALNAARLRMFRAAYAALRARAEDCALTYERDAERERDTPGLHLRRAEPLVRCFRFRFDQPAADQRKPFAAPSFYSGADFRFTCVPPALPPAGPVLAGLPTSPLSHACRNSN